MISIIEIKKPSPTKGRLLLGSHTTQISGLFPFALQLQKPCSCQFPRVESWPGRRELGGDQSHPQNQRPDKVLPLWGQ